jgi:HSP20 family molecular chaperone IbpA
MANNTEVTERQNGSTAVQQQQRGRAEVAMRPPVDIYEDADGITLQADMPGVSRDRLELRVDGNTLIIEGEVQFELAENMEALYADVRANRFRRSFALSRELETEKIDANLKDGVLTVRIPKRAEVRPRKIAVQAH